MSNIEEITITYLKALKEKLNLILIIILLLISGIKNMFGILINI